MKKSTIRLNRSRAIRYKSREEQRPIKKCASCKCSLGSVVQLDKSPHRLIHTSAHISSPQMSPKNQSFHECSSSPSLDSLASKSPTWSSDKMMMKYDEGGGGSAEKHPNKEFLCWRPSDDLEATYLSTCFPSTGDLPDNVDSLNSNSFDAKDKSKVVTYSDEWSASTSESRDSGNEDSQCLERPSRLGINNSTSLYDTKYLAKNKSKATSPTHEHSLSTSSAPVFQGLDDVIKTSHSLPNRLNRNSRRDKNDWRSLDLKPVRTEGKSILLDEIINNLRESKKLISCVDESEILTRRMKKKLRKLLNITPKLHKCFKKGLYLVSLVHQNGKVLVTNEDSLPALEVRCEQNLSEISLKWDFNWLAKVLCDWSNVKILKRTFEKPRNISDSIEFRFRLLEATFNMQKIVGVECLGTLHYQLLTDQVSGSHVFLLVANLPEGMKINSFLRWCSIQKLRRKKSHRSLKSSPTSESSRPSIVQQDGDIMASIYTSIPELISFNASCSTKLTRGLYLGYVKLTSFIDQLRIMVSRSLPNVFPHVRIRDDQRVSREEWESITGANRLGLELSGCQEVFRRRLFEASKSLLSNTGVPEENILSHRLYINEVFEFNSEVSFILLLPNNRNVCSGIGEEETLKPGYMTLPLHQFEIYHMSTYHPDLTKRYSHVSTLMEAEVTIFNHLMRQEVSDEDELVLREQIGQLNLQQKKLDEIWKSMRWISEVISNARDGRNCCGLTLDKIKPPNSNCSN